MATSKVALAGATGMLGRHILDALLAANRPVVVLSRTGSDAQSRLPSAPLITVHEVDYKSADSIGPALKDVDVVISTLGSLAVGEQLPLVDAAASAGVKRFIPSEFGSDTSNPNNANLPVYAGKVATQKRVKQLAAENPSFTYTLFFNNLFLDSGIASGFIIDPATHTAKIYDGGAVPISATRLSTVAQGVAAVLNHLDATKNRAVYVHDCVTTQNQLIDMVKAVDGHQEWVVTPVDSAKLREDSFAELKKDKPDFGKAMVGFLPSAVYGRGSGGNFEGKTDNALLGIKEMGKEEVEEMIRGIVKGGS